MNNWNNFSGKPLVSFCKFNGYVINFKIELSTIYTLKIYVMSNQAFEVVDEFRHEYIDFIVIFL